MYRFLSEKNSKNMMRVDNNADRWTLQYTEGTNYNQHRGGAEQASFYINPGVEG